MKDKIEYLQCVSCKRTFSPDEIEYTCPDCGTVKGTLDVIYNFKAVKKYFSKQRLSASTEYSHWRYLPLLPVFQPDFIQPLKVGWSPLYRFEALNNKLGLPRLYLKDDSGNATHSYKDRASSVAIVKALIRPSPPLPAETPPPPSRPLRPAPVCPAIFMCPKRFPAPS